VTRPNDSNRIVVLTDTGLECGTEDKRAAHEGKGAHHLAVSVQLVDLRSGWLLQQRSWAKPLFGGRWANSCCTHPRPGEAPAEAAKRRVRQELGLVVPTLFNGGSFCYRAVDPVSGLVEDELDHVFLAVSNTSDARDNLQLSINGAVTVRALGPIHGLLDG
jgi:isopentenyl-diphosphate Delta-isomerase